MIKWESSAGHNGTKSHFVIKHSSVSLLKIPPNSKTASNCPSSSVTGPRTTSAVGRGSTGWRPATTCPTTPSTESSATCRLQSRAATSTTHMTTTPAASIGISITRSVGLPIIILSTALYRSITSDSRGWPFSKWVLIQPCLRLSGDIWAVMRVSGWVSGWTLGVCWWPLKGWVDDFKVDYLDEI